MKKPAVMRRHHWPLTKNSEAQIGNARIFNRELSASCPRKNAKLIDQNNDGR